MAITVFTANWSDTPIELQEYVDAIDGAGDLTDQDTLLETASVLKRLGANRRLLLSYLNAHLKDFYSSDKDNPYSVQSYVLALHPNFMVRANVWVKPKDYGAGTSWETKAFIYGAPHNHNFDFLTIGYLGGGYNTDIYELKSEVSGHAGEKAELVFLESTKLPLGKIMLFRKFKDVHNQLPPDDLISVSLNLMVTNVEAFKREQYEFNLRNGTVIGAVNRSALAERTLFALARILGDGNTLSICESIYRTHCKENTKLHALDAMEGLSQEPDQLWVRAMADQSSAVRQEAVRRLQRLRV